MNSIQDIFQEAELSEAAYADFSNQNISPLAALQAYGFGYNQATDFLTHWKVIEQIPNTSTGFSATVFERLDGDNAGERYIAIRGTEGLTGVTDWMTNFTDIGADGIAIHQAIDMYNWYQRMISPAGSVNQYKYIKEETNGFNQITSPASIDTYTITATNDGVLYSGSKPTTVVGHSLGGHLAMILSRMVSNITSATTFNAPGFDTTLGIDLTTLFGFPAPVILPSVNALTSERFFELLSIATDSEIGTGWTATMNNLTITGDWVSQIGTIPNGQEGLYSESANTNPLDAHLMPAITDALAVANLYAQTQADLTVDTITAILKASSNITENSLESTVSALGNIFINDFNKREGNEYDSDRNLLYEDINDIAGAIPVGSTMSISTFITSAADGSDIALPASQIENMACSNIAYRYALVNLNPFAVTGIDYDTKFNQEGELDVYSPDTPDGQLTGKYLQDRANFLAQLIYEGINDTGYTDATIDNVVYSDLPNYYYLDVATDKQALNAPYSSLNPSSDIDIQKEGYQQFIFGSSEGDPEIAGGSKVDHLYDSSPKAFFPHRAVFEIAAEDGRVTI